MDGPTMMPIPSHIESITAPLILGEIFGAYMFGVLSVQFYIYYQTFPNDLKYVKALVYCVFLVELASSTMSIYDTYRWFASGYGNMVALNDIYLSSIDTPMMEAIVGAALQLFYCFRIYTLNKKAWIISVFVALLALTEVTAGSYIAISTVVKQQSILQTAASQFTPLYILWVSAATADVIIAVTMVTLLISHRRSISFASHQRSNDILTRIINLIVETNLATACLAVLIVSMHAGFPDENWFTCPALILGRVYSNSLLLILNNRKYLRVGVNQPEISNGPVELHRLHATLESAASGENKATSVQINLETVTEVHMDSYRGVKDRR